MEEPERRGLLESALPLLAIVLITSGIIVRTVPLQSKRPIDPEHAKVSHAGRQDVEARLWEDPFGAIRHIKGSSPDARCQEALRDKAHYPYPLSERFASARKRANITVLPVLLQGGPHFENGESRRRARYAVVMALLNEGWDPSDEDKMGYVWTFESCLEDPPERRIPELLPYEWFVKEPEQSSTQSDAQPPRRSRVLILWVDEDAVSRRPLEGVERLAKLLTHPETLCNPHSLSDEEGDQESVHARQGLAEKLREYDACARMSPSPQHPWIQSVAFPTDVNNIPTLRVSRRESNAAPLEQTQAHSLPATQSELARSDIRVVGPSTSTALQNMVRELASRLVRELKSPPIRFISATATVDLSKEFPRALERAKSRSDVADSTISPETLRTRFNDRIVRLTTTDEKLAKGLGEELLRRLGVQTSWRHLMAHVRGRTELCDETIVIVGQDDTPYTRLFREHFVHPPAGSPLKDAWPEGCVGGVVQTGYLRGLDGILPIGRDAPPSAASQHPASDGSDTRAERLEKILPDQATLERADGRSQYDYLRRLGEHLIALDRRKRQEGGRGVTAIGVLGNDTYDKLLVLEALREYFPRAVFFTHDLDARLLGREVVRSTRNLIVASAYGLKLHRALQGTAPPFRDTYQTGTYFATRVALHSDAQNLQLDLIDKWFATPRLFEIGRTRAVPLSQVNPLKTENKEPWEEPNKKLALQQVRTIHPDDE
jgi:hypothetical protein